jgi:hypothetical protein
MMDHELFAVREWAQGRLEDAAEPPWARRRYQHMIARLDQMLGARVQTPEAGDKIVSFDRARRRSATRDCRSDR